MSDRPVIDVTGVLDEVAGARLWSSMSELVDDRPSGVAVDLSGVTGASEAGVQALSRCLAAARCLPDGVEIMVSSAAGRQVLLDTFSTV